MSDDVQKFALAASVFLIAEIINRAGSGVRRPGKLPDPGGDHRYRATSEGVGPKDPEDDKPSLLQRLYESWPGRGTSESGVCPKGLDPFCEVCTEDDKPGFFQRLYESRPGRGPPHPNPKYQTGKMGERSGRPSTVTVLAPAVIGLGLLSSPRT